MPTLAPLLYLQAVGKAHRHPLPAAPLPRPIPLFPPRPNRDGRAEPFICGLTVPAGHLASLSLSFHLREMGAYFPCSLSSQGGEGLMR